MAFQHELDAETLWVWQPDGRTLLVFLARQIARHLARDLALDNRVA